MPYAQLLLNDLSSSKKSSPSKGKDRAIIGAVWTVFALTTLWTHPPFSKEATRHNVGLSPVVDPLLAIRVEAKFNRPGVPPLGVQPQAN